MRSSRIAIIPPVGCLQSVRFPYRQRANPILVPIHRLPSRPPSRELMRDDGNSFPSGGLHATNRTPSKRINPACVPIQRYPSVVWAITLGAPAKTPSSIRHAVCPYWEICLVVSSAPTELIAEKNKTKQNKRSLGGYCLTVF